MAIMSALWGASLVFVVLRALSKYMTRTFFIEDHIIIASVVLAVVPMVCVLYSEEYLVSLRSLIFHVDETDEPLFAQNIVAALGFGSHIYDLEDGALPQILRLCKYLRGSHLTATPLLGNVADKATILLTTTTQTRTVYVAEIIYVVALALTKASILSMYLRIFWAFPPFQVACYLALGFILLPSAVITLVTIFSCRPVAYFWDRDVRVALAAASASTGAAALPTCVDVGALAYANSGFAVAQDVVLIALPVGMLWRLNMSRRRKALVAVMFAVGSLGLVATVARLRVLYVFGDFTDPTWTWVPVVYWTTAELAAGIICSCLPAVRILLERFSRVFRLTTTTGGEGGAAAGECSSHVVAIRMERARRQTAGDADAEEGRWKDGEWMEMGDGASERGLTQTREGDDDMSDYLTPRGHGPKGIRSDFEIGI